jgi:uncharacterized MAPEG superfamily protein
MSATAPATTTSAGGAGDADDNGKSKRGGPRGLVPPPSPGLLIHVVLPYAVGAVLAFPLLYYGVEEKLTGMLLSVFAGAPALLPKLPFVAVILFALLNNFLASRAFHARSVFRVPHPIQHPGKGDVSDDARHRYLCYVRSHENFLESFAQLLAAYFCAAFVGKLSVLATLLCVIVVCGRVVYAIGYSSGYPKRRLLGLLLAVIPSFILHGLLIDLLIL